jgi:hypothetical protein
MCVTLRITGFVDFAYCPETTKHNISKTDLFSSSGEWREITTLLGPLEIANLIHRHVCGIMSLVRSYKNCGCISCVINLRQVLCPEGTYSA